MTPQLQFSLVILGVGIVLDLVLSIVVGILSKSWKDALGTFLIGFGFVLFVFVVFFLVSPGPH